MLVGCGLWKNNQDVLKHTLATGWLKFSNTGTKVAMLAWI